MPALLVEGLPNQRRSNQSGEWRLVDEAMMPTPFYDVRTCPCTPGKGCENFIWYSQLVNEITSPSGKLWKPKCTRSVATRARYAWYAHRKERVVMNQTGLGHFTLSRWSAAWKRAGLENKTLFFLGDSVHRQQWTSMVCMLAASNPSKNTSMVADFGFRSDHTSRVHFGDATLALYPRMSYWGALKRRGEKPIWVSPAAINFMVGSNADVFVDCFRARVSQKLPLRLSHVVGPHPACSQNAIAANVCRLFVLECDAQQNHCVKFSRDPALQWWSPAGIPGQHIHACMVETMKRCEGGCNHVMDRTAPTIALAMIHDDVDLETEVHSGDIVLFNSLLMYNRNRFDAGALLTIWNATLAIGKTSPTRSPHLIYRETHAQAFGAGTDGLYTAHTTCGAIDPTLATGNWRDALLAPILNRYNYQTLAIHELSALFAALGVNVFARLKPGARGPMDCTHQCLPSPDIDTWNLLLLNAIEAGLDA